jgi:hypothetical protein
MWRQYSFWSGRCHTDRRRPPRMVAGGHTRGIARLTKPRRPHKSAPPLGSHGGSVGSACTRPSGPAVGVAGPSPAPSSSTCGRHTRVRWCVNTAELAQCQAKSPRRLQLLERRRRAEAAGVVAVTEVVGGYRALSESLTASTHKRPPPKYGGSGRAGVCIYMTLAPTSTSPPREGPAARNGEQKAGLRSSFEGPPAPFITMAGVAGYRWQLDGHDGCLFGFAGLGPEGRQPRQLSV